MFRIRSFIMEGIEPYHSQLQKLLFPLFAHIFLELLIAGHRKQGVSYVRNTWIILNDAEVVL